MVSSPKPQTATTNTAPWEGQQPYLREAFQGAQDLYRAGAPAYYGGSTVAEQSPYTAQANQAIANLALNGNPAVNAGQNQLISTIQGDYLNSNPYLDATFNKAARGVTENFNQIVNPGIDSQYALGGRLGQNAAYATTRNQSDNAAGRQLSDLATSIYGGNYAQERQNQLNALNTAQNYQTGQLNNLGALGTIGQQQTDYNQQLRDADIARYNYNAQAPYNNLSNYLGLIQGNYGQSGTTTQSVQKPNALSQGLGLALSAGQLYAMSDINSKENIEHVSQENGHNVYEFNYIGEPERYRGVMAQEVQKTRPDAVISTSNGLMVNYNKIGIKMKRVK